MCVVTCARKLPLVEFHQEKERRDDHAQLDRASPACLPALRERNPYPERAAKKQYVRNNRDLVVEDIRRAKFLVAALPGLGHF